MVFFIFFSTLSFTRVSILLKNGEVLTAKPTVTVFLSLIVTESGVKTTFGMKKVGGGVWDDSINLGTIPLPARADMKQF